MTKYSVFAWIFASIAASFTVPALSQEIGSRAMALEPMALQSGWNDVPNLAQNGRNGAIVLAWRDNGNAHGYDLFTVLLASGSGPRPVWEVVGFDRENEFSDSVRDAPHVGEDMTRSVRFARGLYDGRPATMAFISTREPSEQSIPHPTRALVETFVLRANTEGSGSTSHYFARVEARRTETEYCHAEMAIFVEIGLPLRSGYEGQHSADGC